MEIEWRAFELRSGMPVEGIPRPEKPGEGKELSSNIKRLADEIGLKMKRPDFIACSRPALEATEFAKNKGKFDQFHLGVFKAYWEEGRNIGLKNILRDIAEKCGLNGDELEQCLDEGRYTGVIENQNREARMSGINSIPAFIIGDSFIAGAQSYEIFKKTVEINSQ